MSRWGVVGLLLFLTGCVSPLPKSLQMEPAENPSLHAVLAQTDHYVGSIVRWGGTVASIENGEKETLLEVVERPLAESGRPWRSDRTHGRFLVRVKGFLDPDIYAKGRAVTIKGVVDGEREGEVGEHPYRYVLLHSQVLHLWSKQPGRVRSDVQIYVDPFYFYRPYFYYGHHWH
ncbi:MAG: Slp family lipoprotein [Gammaproteobacteria bacterium]|nr:Slp family lipoprotein [Gammaproteobacteria bacterium]